MNYVDYTLVRLADESLRAALFDQVALEQLALAAYDAEAMLLGGPYTAVFDELTVGLSIPGRGTAEACWDLSAGGERREGRVSLYGLGAASTIRVDAFWRGAVVARAVSPMSRIQQVITTWPDANGIDQEISAALGSLPTDLAQLEAERRTRLTARLRAGLRQPGTLSDATFDRWLHQIGVRSVTELMERFANQLGTGVVQVGFSPPSSDPPAPRRLPVSVAILVRDAPFQVADLLADSKRIREQLRDLGVERAPDPDAMVRQPVLVAWMIPDTTFNDVDWPGGESGGNDDAKRKLRRQAAGRWLAREGVGLVTTPGHK